MRLRFLSAALSLSVLFAAFQFPVSAASEPSITSGILSSLATAFGVSDLDGVYCVNCGEKVNLDGLESGLLSAVCPSCEKSVFLNSDGKVSVGGFSGFGGGSSRGGGAGRDPEPLVKSDGSISVPLYFISKSPYLKSHGPYVDAYVESSSKNFLWLSSSSTSVCLYASATVPVSGRYKFHYSGKVWSDVGFKYSYFDSGTDQSTIAYADKPIVIDCYGETLDLLKGAPRKSIVGYSHIPSAINRILLAVYCSTNELTNAPYPIYGFLSGEAVLVDDYSHPTIDSPSVDEDTSSVVFGSVSIPYQSIYKYGDTYITYNNEQSTVYYTDQSGAILGSCVFDNSTNTFQITDFSSNPPTPTPSPAPTPVPSAAPQPSASPVPSSAPQPSASPGGSGGSDSGGSDSGGSDSGSGIWGGIADAIAGLLSAIGTLIGGILKGFIDLLSNMLGTVTSALPLISDVAALISGLYSFLPEDWQTILTAAFSLLLTFSVVKLVLGVMGK